MEFYTIWTSKDGKRYFIYDGFIDCEEYENIKGCEIPLDKFVKDDDRIAMMVTEACKCTQYGTSISSSPEEFEDDALRKLIFDACEGRKHLPIDDVGMHTKDGCYFSEDRTFDKAFFTATSMMSASCATVWEQ